MVTRSAIIVWLVLLCGLATAGGESTVGVTPARSNIKFSGRAIDSTGVHRYGHDLQRNLPMPAPNRCIGHGKEYNEFYGPTYYDPWHHNVWERLNPTYYPFFHPREWPNYKAPGDYCVGKRCGPSRSSGYWDSYDDWMRGGRYEQHQ